MSSVSKSSGGNSKYAVDLVDTIASVRRVTKVVTGGSRFSFSVLVVVGDKKGRVGCGSAKDRELNEAKAKALKAAKRSMFHVPLRGGKTLHHDASGRYCSGHVMLRSARAGTGIVAGGAMRDVFECLGISDVVAKSFGSSNPYNVTHATINALKLISAPKSVADRRGIKVGQLLSRRSVV